MNRTLGVIESIIIIAVIFGVPIYYYWKRRKSSYFQIKKKVKYDLKTAIQENDREKIQQINLKMLWLETFKKEADTWNSVHLNDFTKETIEYPLKWSLTNYYIKEFVNNILKKFEDFFQYYDSNFNNEPFEDVLPIPIKTYIKALYYTYDLQEDGNSLYILENNEFSRYFDNALFQLNAFIKINTLKEGLKSKDLTRKNQFEDLELIDWLDTNKWLGKIVRYNDKELFNYALIALKKVKEIDPTNKEVLRCEAASYLKMANYYRENNNFDLELQCLKKSSELGENEATILLNQNKIFMDNIGPPKSPTVETDIINKIESIYQDLKIQVELSLSKVKQAEQKHFTNVMSCGHGQYPKHLEIRTTAELYDESISEYSAHKRLLEIMEKHIDSNGKYSGLSDIHIEIDGLIKELSDKGQSDIVFTIKKWQDKLKSF